MISNYKMPPSLANSWTRSTKRRRISTDDGLVSSSITAFCCCCIALKAVNMLPKNN